MNKKTLYSQIPGEDPYKPIQQSIFDANGDMDETLADVVKSVRKDIGAPKIDAPEEEWAAWRKKEKELEDRRDPNIKRATVSQHYPDYDTKKKEYVVPPKQRKGDDASEAAASVIVRAGKAALKYGPGALRLSDQAIQTKDNYGQHQTNKSMRGLDVEDRTSEVDHNKKKREAESKQKSGDDVDEISMQQARKAYGVGQGKTMAVKQRQTKGLGGTGSSQKQFAKRHKAIGAKTGQVKKAVGGPKVMAQTQKRRRAAKMSNMIKGLGTVGQKAIYGSNDSVKENKSTKLNKKQLQEFVRDIVKDILKK